MLRSNRLPSSVPSYLVCDRGFISDYGIGLIHPGTRDLRRFIEADYLFDGGTVGDLAAKIGTDGEALTRTIERYNQYAESGIDEEFGRGTSELNRFNGDPANKPNPCLRKIGPGPLLRGRGLALGSGECAGLRTDARGRVLRSDGGTIKGLYAIGTDAASIFRGTYPDRERCRAGYRLCLAGGHGRRRRPRQLPDTDGLSGARSVKRAESTSRMRGQPS